MIGAVFSMQGLGQLSQAIKHEQVIAGAALLMAAITEHLVSELPLQKAHRSTMHASGLGAIKLQSSNGQSCEVFKPVIAAMAMLGVGLQPTQLLPERLQPIWRYQSRACAKEGDPIQGS